MELRNIYFLPSISEKKNYDDAKWQMAVCTVCEEKTPHSKTALKSEKVAQYLGIKLLVFIGLWRILTGILSWELI